MWTFVTFKAGLRKNMRLFAYMRASDSREYKNKEGGDGRKERERKAGREAGRERTGEGDNNK